MSGDSPAGRFKRSEIGWRTAARERIDGPSDSTMGVKHGSFARGFSERHFQMASIFKRGRDKGRRRAHFYISYDDEKGVRRTKKGFTDKRATEDLAVELEREVRRKREGLVDPDDERRKKANLSPLSEHLAEFETSLGKNTGKHVSLTLTRVRATLEGCGFQTLADLNQEAVESFLTAFMKKKDIGHRTYNHYVQAIDSFCNWLVSTKRILANPLVGLKRLNTEVDVRHKRRALSSEEIRKLVSSARESGKSIQTFSGEDRARIYLISYFTGLRRKEIGSLTPESFDLDAKKPTVVVDAACSKHRKKDVLPLHPELVEMLRVWLEGATPGEPLFPKLERKKTWFMVKKDLERVGIPYETEDGVADFHASGRHTHITELLRNGASLPEARELARHSDIKMTMKYTHIGIDDQAKAVSRLPWESGNGSDKDGPPEDDDESWQRYGSGERRPNGHLPSPAGTQQSPKRANTKKENPGGSRGYDASRQVVAPSGTEGAQVEAAGIEPASCEPFGAASTCVVVLLVLAAFATNDRLAGRAVHNESYFKRSKQ